MFVDTPLAVAEQRDPKGLYKKARRGELKNFTGIDSPYEAPEHPEIYVDTTRTSAEQSAAAIIEQLRPRDGSDRQPDSGRASFAGGRARPAGLMTRLPSE